MSLDPQFIAACEANRLAVGQWLRQRQIERNAPSLCRQCGRLTPPRKQFCNFTCQGRYGAARAAPPMPMNKCLTCGAKFKAKVQSWRKDGKLVYRRQKYCSRGCAFRCPARVEDQRMRLEVERAARTERANAAKIERERALKARPCRACCLPLDSTRRDRLFCRRVGCVRSRLGSNRRPLTSNRKTRDLLCESAGWVCGICGGVIAHWLRYPDPGAASIDHIIPLAAGGDDVPGNWRPAHLGCNWRRSKPRGWGKMSTA